MNNNNFKITIDFEPISRRLYYARDENIYQLLINSGIRVRSLCGGLGTCGKCKIMVQKGNKYLNSPTDSEKAVLTPAEINESWRLACQSRIAENQIPLLETLQPPQIRIFLPQELLVEDFKILTSGLNKGVSLNPNIKKLFVEVNKPNLDDPVPDLERVLISLSFKNGIIKDTNTLLVEFEALKKLPKILREENHRITITLYDNNKIIDFEAGNKVDRNYGIAFDIGTTTLVGYLINLNDGKVYSVASALNPQTAYGEDVITRITYVKDNEDELLKLSSAVVDALNDIIKKNCAKAKIKPSDIHEATVVGNSVMHHIFLNIDPTYIGLSPYVPAIKRGLNLNSKDINLKICAAGSALEGAHVKDGMRAAAGAIDAIKINPNDLTVEYTTINNKKPIGICGSGLIDAVAEMLKAKIITRSGGFNKQFIDHERIIKNDKNFEFIIVKKDETSNKRDITISQNDVRELQMAKAAFFSGAQLILNHINRTRNAKLEIKQIFLAGAFGNYINKNNAKFIGMIPDISGEKIYQIGNAAGIGAQNCLLNTNLRKKASKLLKKIDYVEIAIEKDFQRQYAEAMYFPHHNLELFPNLKEYKNIPKR
ncbi:Na(+)-translocating NADH-quinone reductase subunit F [subsurface metagenome]